MLESFDGCGAKGEKCVGGARSRISSRVCVWVKDLRNFGG